MIETNANKSSLKAIKEREKKEREDLTKGKCESYLREKYGDKISTADLSNKHKGLWFLPVLDEEEKVEKLLVLKPIDRNILSYASTKIQDEGIYSFLEAAMRECAISEVSDMDIFDNDDYFIPTANSFQKILDGKKTMMLKR
jgi:hypothetical protein